MFNYLSKLVIDNAIWDSFVFSMFMDTPEDEKTKLISCLGAFRQFWSGLSQVPTAFLIYSVDDSWHLHFFTYFRVVVKIFLDIRKNCCH